MPFRTNPFLDALPQPLGTAIARATPFPPCPPRFFVTHFMGTIDANGHVYNRASLGERGLAHEMNLKIAGGVLAPDAATSLRIARSQLAGLSLLLDLLELPGSSLDLTELFAASLPGSSEDSCFALQFQHICEKCIFHTDWLWISSPLVWNDWLDSFFRRVSQVLTECPIFDDLTVAQGFASRHGEQEQRLRTGGLNRFCGERMSPLLEQFRTISPAEGGPITTDHREDDVDVVDEDVVVVVDERKKADEDHVVDKHSEDQHDSSPSEFSSTERQQPYKGENLVRLLAFALERHDVENVLFKNWSPKNSRSLLMGLICMNYEALARAILQDEEASEGARDALFIGHAHFHSSFCSTTVSHTVNFDDGTAAKASIPLGDTSTSKEIAHLIAWLVDSDFFEISPAEQQSPMERKMRWGVEQIILCDKFPSFRQEVSDKNSQTKWDYLVQGRGEDFGVPMLRDVLKIIIAASPVLDLLNLGISDFPTNLVLVWYNAAGDLWDRSRGEELPRRGRELSAKCREKEESDRAQFSEEVMPKIGAKRVGITKKILTTARRRAGRDDHRPPPRRNAPSTAPEQLTAEQLKTPLTTLFDHLLGAGACGKRSVFLYRILVDVFGGIAAVAENVFQQKKIINKAAKTGAKAKIPPVATVKLLAQWLQQCLAVHSQIDWEYIRVLMGRAG